MSKCVFRIRKKDFAKIIKNQCGYTSKYDSTSILSGINIKVADNVLTTVSTDGNRLLETKTKLNDCVGEFSPVTFVGEYLRKIKFIKGINISRFIDDILEITLTNKMMDITDVCNKFTYSIPIISGKYPKYKKVIPKTKKNSFVVGINKYFLEDLKYLSVGESTPYIRIQLNERNPLAAIKTISKIGDETECTTALMPARLS